VRPLEKRYFSVRVNVKQKSDVEIIFNLKSGIEGYQPSEYNFFS
jgi:hypothetical protein